MIRLSGLISEEDVNIEYTGFSSGEKNYEELFYDYEMSRQRSHEKMFIKQQDLAVDFNAKIDKVINAVKLFDNEKLRELPDELVPRNE